MKKENKIENEKINNQYNLNFINNNSNRYNNNENFYYQSLNNNPNIGQNYLNNQNNINDFNNANNYFNYYNFLNNNSNIINNSLNNYNNSNIKHIDKEIILPEKTSKNKNTPKRNNYIPKNLLTNLSQAQNKNIFPKDKNVNNSQNYFSSIPNLYHNNMLLSEHKNSFESQNSNNNSLIDTNFKNIINDIKNNENEDADKNNLFKPFTYIFNANIEDVKEVFTDNLFFKNHCPESIIDNVKFTTKSFVDEGNVISLRWKKFYTLELKTTKTFYSKTYIYYKLNLINLKPFNIGNLEMTFKYYYNTCQSKTLFIIEYVLDKGILSEVFKEEFLDFDMNQICKSCEKIINEREKERMHISSVFFNANKEYAMNFIMNFNKNKYINYNNNMSEYDLENLNKEQEEINNSEKNDKIMDISEKPVFKLGDSILIKKSKDNILGKLFIEDIKNENDKTEIIISFENLNNDETNEENKEQRKEKERIEIINQKISLTFRQISKNLSFFEFKHIWHIHLSEEKIRYLNILKNASLMQFEREFECKNNDNLKNKTNKERKKAKERLNFFNLVCPLKK